MIAKQAIRQTVELGSFLIKSFLNDFSEADWLQRPVPNANHTAWQMGHLIEAGASFHNKLPGVSPIELPKGFAEKHKTETASIDTPSAFYTKAEYLALFDKVQGALLTALEGLADSDLDTPTEGPMASVAPTRGAMFVLMGSHPIMHVGQFSVLRRKLGKPHVM